MNSDPTPPRISLRDIAAELGVSHSTVSLSLRDHPRISAEMKDKVRRAAEALGYRPDPMLGALAKYRRGRGNSNIQTALAWVNAWPEPESLRACGEFDSYWQGAFTAAGKCGFQLEEFRLGNECDPNQLHQMLSSRDIRGILLPPHPIEPDWRDFPWDEYSIVRFDRSPPHPACHVVTADPIGNMLLALRKMDEKGYKRIGFVTIDGGFNMHGMQSELGYLGGMRLIGGIDPIPVLVLDRNSTAECGNLFNEWRAKHQSDAIITPDPTLADLLKQLDVRIPDDIGLAVTSIGDAKGVSGIDIHPEEIGRVGFQMLHSLINDRVRGIPAIFRQTLVEGSWVDGASLHPR